MSEPRRSSSEVGRLLPAAIAASVTTGSCTRETNSAQQVLTKRPQFDSSRPARIEKRGRRAGLPLTCGSTTRSEMMRRGRDRQRRCRMHPNFSFPKRTFSREAISSPKRQAHQAICRSRSRLWLSVPPCYALRLMKLVAPARARPCRAAGDVIARRRGCASPGRSPH